MQTTISRIVHTEEDFKIRHKNHKPTFFGTPYIELDLKFWEN